MLVYIEDTEIDLEEESHFQAIENLLSAHFHGMHYVYCKNISLLKKIISDVRFSANTVSSAQHIKSNRSFNQSLFNGEFDFLSTSGIGSNHPTSSKNGWHVNINFFADRTATDRSTVIGESLFDVDLFTHAAKQELIRKNTHRTITLNFSARTGGGNSTNRSFERALREGHQPIMCIVDSDKKHSKDNIKETARRASRVISQSDMAKVYILEVRAAENTIPKNVLKNVFPDKAEFIDQNFTNLNPTPFAYANLKKGTKLAEIINLINSNRSGFEEWKSWINQAGVINPDNECLVGEECLQEECSCSLVPPMSENCLDKVIEYLDQNNQFSNTKNSNESIYDVWKRIGKLFAEFCAAPEPIRIP